MSPTQDAPAPVPAQRPCTFGPGAPASVREWLAALTHEVDAPAAVVFAPDADGALHPAEWVGYPDDLVHTWRRLDLTGTPAAEAFADDRVVVVLEVAPPRHDYPKLDGRPRGPGSALVAVPVPGPAGAPVAVLGVSFASGDALLAAGVRWSAVAGDLAELLARHGAPHPLAPAVPAVGAGSDAVVGLATRLLAANSPEDVLDEVLAAALPALGAEFVNICLLEPDGEMLRLVVSRRTTAAVEAEFATFARHAPLPAREALDRLRPVLMRSLAERDRLYPALASFAVEQQAFATLPLRTPDEELGVITFGWVNQQAFDRRQVRTLEAVAAWCSAALHRARLQSAVRSTAEVLQRALLPRLIAVPGWDVAAHYAPATEGTQVGGDWYDVFDLPGGRVGLALGDVMGKGTGAAAVMGSVRSALRAFASIDPDPAAVLTRLDGFVAANAPDQLVTCTYLALEPATGRLRYARAGHPPALVVSRRRSRWLDAALEPPLNGRRAPSRTAPRPFAGLARLAPGDVLLLYTDGLVERRGHDPDHAQADLRRAAGAMLAAPDLEAACWALVDALAHPDRNVDDLAVLALRRRDLSA